MPVRVLALGGKDHDWGGFSCLHRTYFFENFQAGGPGHHDIQKDQIVVIGPLHRFERIGSILPEVDVESGHFKEGLQDTADMRLVVGDQNAPT